MRRKQRKNGAIQQARRWKRFAKKVHWKNDASSVLKEKLPYFLKHGYIKREQAKYFESKIENLQGDEVVVQVDFSKNYACKHQDEIDRQLTGTRNK